MNRFFTSLFAISSVSIAAVLLFIAMSYIRKNSPKEQDVEVRRTPPTAPNVDSESSNKSEYPSSANFIGGVGIVEPVGEATVIGSQLPGVVEEVCVQPGDLVKAGDPLIRLDVGPQSQTLRLPRRSWYRSKLDWQNCKATLQRFKLAIEQQSRSTSKRKPHCAMPKRTSIAFAPFKGHSRYQKKKSTLAD